MRLTLARGPEFVDERWNFARVTVCVERGGERLRRLSKLGKAGQFFGETFFDGNGLLWLAGRETEIQFEIVVWGEILTG